MNDPAIISDVDPRGFSPGEFPSSMAYPLEACDKHPYRRLGGKSRLWTGRLWSWYSKEYQDETTPGRSRNYTERTLTCTHKIESRR